MKKRIIGILSVLVAILVMSHNAGALELNLEVQTLWGNYVPNPVEYVLAQPYNSGSGLFICYNSAGGNWNRVRGVNFSLPSGYTPRSGDLIEFSFNATSDSNQNVNVAFGAQATANGWDVVSWTFENATNSAGALKVILVAGSQASRNISLMRPDGWTLFDLNEHECVGISNIGIYRPKGDSSQAIVDAINNSSDSASINSAKEAIVNAINQQKQAEENYYNEQEEATENIENQTPQGMSSSGNTENQASSNLIDLIRSFVSALTTINSGNCDITLDFPSYAGGSRTVNICQNKDKAGNLISVFSSLTLIVFYIPLAFKLLTMIYNEIRSFTNG